MAFDWINKRENGRKLQTLLSNALESISTQMILCLYRQPHLSSALLHHNLLMLTYGRVLYVLTVNYATVLYLQLTDFWRQIEQIKLMEWLILLFVGCYRHLNSARRNSKQQINNFCIIKNNYLFLKIQEWKNPYIGC